jgi:FkbM family methyltransferase
MLSTLKDAVRPYKNKVMSVFPKKSPIYHRLSYSQEGEDMILARIFEGKSIGFYVDVGAHHPQRFSNTYFFYLQGWMGINLDPMPGSMDGFKALRPRDINLELAISSSRQVLTYYRFNESALNGFDQERALKRDGLCDYKIISKENIQTNTLVEVLDKYLPSNQMIDFLNIDVEGLDFDVLQSNDWQKYKPVVVLVEDLDVSLEETDKSMITSFMKEQGYQLYCRTPLTSIFQLKN